ncbi:unnamed protein product [Angiostrongylus costaricensis]|uniref:DC_STAMP domain-containing protein n=1 Tax=Angiostrongylus costaricensis TaxID=334426 RepID=A0A0R3PT66_ANGCS|nr:unnamed protein product [Angiostrongylus costaricensis]
MEDLLASARVTRRSTELQVIKVIDLSTPGRYEASCYVLIRKLKKSLTDFFNQYVAMFELMQMVIEQIFVPYTIIWPFISTALFTYNFNYREEYENNFLTDEFDKIDLDMALRGQTKVLPLNKNEKLQVLSNVYYYTGLVTIDYPSHYEVKVSGTGEAAKMMRSMQEVFSPLTSDIRERDDRWRKCFVEPNPPDENTLWTIILLFIISVFLCRFQKLLADDQIAGRETIVRRGLQSRGFIRVNCSICNEPDLRIADESYHDMQMIDRVEMYYEDPTDDEESEDELEGNEDEEINAEADLNIKASATTLP